MNNYTSEYISDLYKSRKKIKPAKATEEKAGSKDECFLEEGHFRQREQQAQRLLSKMLSGLEQSAEKAEGEEIVGEEMVRGCKSHPVGT